MKFIHSHDLGDNINNFEQIIQKIKETKKYQHLIIVNNNIDYTTAIINLGENDVNKKITKKDFTFHLKPSKKISENTNIENSTICSNNYEINEFYRELDGCKHVFHKKCIDEWFFKSKSYSCPLCRNHPYSLEK